MTFFFLNKKYYNIRKQNPYKIKYKLVRYIKMIF